MSTKFYFYNELENAITTCSNVNAQFPLSNLLDPRRTKVFRSTTGTTSIILDLRRFVELDSFIAVDNTLTGFGFTSATISLNGTTNWAVPIATYSVSIDTEKGFASVEFTKTTARFVKIDLVSSFGACELSNIFIGAKTQIASIDLSLPLLYKVDNLSSTSINRYGQKFIDETVTQRRVKSSLEHMYKEEFDIFEAAFSYHLNTIPFFMALDNFQGSSNGNKINGMYYLDKEPEYSFQGGNLWSVGIELVEAN